MGSLLFAGKITICFLVLTNFEGPISLNIKSMKRKPTSARFQKARVLLAFAFPVNANNFQIDTSFPDNLRLWRNDKIHHIPRSNTSMRLDGEARFACIE